MRQAIQGFTQNVSVIVTVTVYDKCVCVFICMCVYIYRMSSGVVCAYLSRRQRKMLHVFLTPGPPKFMFLKIG